MGKAAVRRKERRRAFFEKLSRDNPERFEQEWAKRLESWSAEIWRRARRGKIRSQSVFETVDYAKGTLVDCGQDAIDLQEQATDDLLNTECCRALAQHIESELYRISPKWETNTYSAAKFRGRS